MKSLYSNNNLIITFGTNQFNRDDFDAVRNDETYRNKPSGGLWGSTFRPDEDFRSDYELMCIREEKNIDNLFDWIVYRLKPDTVVRDIHTYSQIVYLSECYPVIHKNHIERKALNFEKMAVEGIDALHVYGGAFLHEKKNDIESFAEWDPCETWYIMNPDCIDTMSIISSKDKLDLIIL